MQHQEITITIPIESKMDPLFLLTLNEHIAEVFRCLNRSLSSQDIQVDIHEGKLDKPDVIKGEAPESAVCRSPLRRRSIRQRHMFRRKT